MCERAQLLVVAVGKPGLIPGDWIAPGATVIDVGINRLPDGSLRGDVDFDSRPPARGLDHAGARRRRADDHRTAAGEHPGGGASPLRDQKPLSL